MPNLLDMDRLTQILTAIKNSSGDTVTYPLAIDKGGTGVTTIEEVRKEITGFDKTFLSSIDNISITIGEFSATNATSLRYSNIIGRNAGQNATSIMESDIIGTNAGGACTEINSTILLGYASGGKNASNAVVIGSNAGEEASNIESSVVVGRASGDDFNNAILDSVLIGSSCGASNASSIERSVAIGQGTCSRLKDASYGVFVGARVADGNAAKTMNMRESVLIGYDAGHSTDAACEGSPNSVGIGYRSLSINKVGQMTIGIGYYASNSNNADKCVFIGDYSGRYDNFVCCTAIGSNAMNHYSPGSDIKTITNSTSIGYQSTVTGSNQVQLGNSSTTTYVYGTVQNRSDERDKANITDLDYEYTAFIDSLKPRSYQWDMREDYLPDIRDGTVDHSMSIDGIVHDGTHTRTRRHSGFVAQEVKEAMDVIGFDFAGYQDHSVNGGADVLSLGYDEFIAPIVAYIQDLRKENQYLRQQLELVKKHIGMV